jgi:hypothetical protein
VDDTQSPPSPYDETRHTFEITRVEAWGYLGRDGNPLFALWSLAAIRRQPSRELRHAALDGVMAAMDDDEARRDE